MYWPWTNLKKLGLPYWTGIDFVITGPGLKKWINQEEMSLEKYEDFLELSVKQLVIQSIPISLGQILCGVWKTKH